VYDYNSISYEARERARTRQHDGERERIAHQARAHRRGRRSRLTEALSHLRQIQRGRLAGGI
jgi:hypothetical protein